MADSAPSPSPGARGRKSTSADGGKIPPRTGAAGRPSTSQDGGNISPRKGAAGRKTSDNFENPGIPATLSRQRQSTRPTPDATTRKSVKGF
jgi:hypothetical protein